MALVLANRVQETATANTTVSFTLTGAIQGFQTFAAVGDTNTTYYSATDAFGNWEVGLGTYSTTGPTLTRTTVYASSNSGLAVTFSGTVNVFLTYPSGRSVNLDASGNVSALGTVASGTWQGSTVGVAYGGTGVTTSSGANSVVLRDSNQNITVNRISQGTQTVTAAGGTTILTAASQFNQTLTGTGGQTYRLPDATTLTDTTTFQFNNNATGTLTITDYASATIGTVAAGGAAGIALLDNSTTGGTWDVHAYIPENVTWGTNSLALGSTVITGGTWNGGTISSAYGGTGLTTFAGANNALYSTSASALAAGTLPVAAGGTGNTSGQATSVANSLTINNGGAGDASGITFNGSAARTISYNTVGAPSTTGTNASGTWNINISGTAATATSATSATSATNASNVTGGNISGAMTGTLAAGSQALDMATNDNYVSMRVVRNNTAAGGNADGMYIGYANGNSGATRIYGGGATSGGIIVNGSGVNNVTIAGSIALNAGNYNSYAPTLTGGGASGTWSINITGSAGSAGSVAWGNVTGKPSNIMYYQGFTLDANTMDSNATGFTYSVNAPYTGPIARFSTGGSYDLWLNSPYNSNGYGLAFRTRNGDTNTLNSWQYPAVYGVNVNGGGALYATTYYDQNNTGYYVDPNSWSVMSSLILGDGGGNAYTNPNTNGLCFGTNTPSDYRIYTEMENYNGNYTKLTLAWHTGIRLYTQNTYGGVRFFSSSTGGSVVFSVNEGDANTRVYNNLYAPIMYDLNNTGYYVDPTSYSQFSGVYANNWFRPQGDTGLYFESYGYGLWAPQSGGNSYGNVTTYATGRNGWTGYGLGSRITLMTDTNTGGTTTGMHDSNVGWYWRYVYDSYFTVDRGYSIFANSARAPIFYDSNNTGYYCDPNGTSNFAGLTVGNTISGNISGYSMAVGPYAAGSGSIYTGRSVPYSGVYTYVTYGDPNAPTYYGAGVGFGNGSGGSCEIIANWVDGTPTGLWFRTLRDCCTNWTGWVRIANYYYATFGTDISSTGNVTAYSSDRRLKTNITPIESPLEKLEKIGGYTFDWDVEKCNELNFKPSNVHEHGVIAQEIQEIMPDAVTLAPFDLDADGNPISGQNYLTVRYERIVPLLIAAIKEQNDQIKQMQHDLSTLRGGAI